MEEPIRSENVRPRLRALLTEWGVRIATLLTILMGVINVTSAITPALKPRLALLENILPLEVRAGSRLAAVLAGFALLVLASGLWRRKRASWLLTLLVLAVSLVSHLAKGLDFEEASFAFFLILLLATLHGSFRAFSDRPSLKRGLLVLLFAFVFTLFYGVIGFYVLDSHFKINFGLGDALRQTFVMFTTFNNPGLEPITQHGRFFAFSIYLVAAITVGYALMMLIRPVLVRDPSTPVEREKAAEIVNHYGKTALARPALFADKSYFFSPGGSLFACGARGRGVMVLGDPIGPDADFLPALEAFKEFCHRNDWSPSFVSVLPDHLAEYRQAGFDAVCLGNEAIVALQEFTLEGSQNKNIRNEYNRLVRLGYSVAIFEPPLEQKLLHQLRQISDAWMTLQHGGEMHFSDGWFDNDYIRNCPVAIVRDQDGNPVAFANIVSEYTKNELTLDLMRHYPRVERGTMELLFVTMLNWAKEKGYETFSLGLSAIVGVGEKPDDPRVERALHTIAEYVSRFFNFKGLHAFKSKFHPRWEPRYLVFPGAANLPLVLTTLLRVHSGDNFLWKYFKKS